MTIMWCLLGMLLYTTQGRLLPSRRTQPHLCSASRLSSCFTSSIRLAKLPGCPHFDAAEPTDTSRPGLLF